MDTGKAWQSTQSDGLYSFPSYQDAVGPAGLPPASSADTQWQHMMDALISSNSGPMQYLPSQPSLGNNMRHSLSSNRFDADPKQPSAAVILKVSSWNHTQQQDTQQAQPYSQFPAANACLDQDFLMRARFDQSAPGDGGLGMPPRQHDMCSWDNTQPRQSLPSGLVESGFPVCKIERQDLAGLRSKGDVLGSLDLVSLPSTLDPIPPAAAAPQPAALHPPWRAFTRHLTGQEMASLFPSQYSSPADIHVALQFKASGHTDPVVYSARLMHHARDGDEGARYVSALDPSTSAEIHWHAFGNAQIYWQRGQQGQLIMCIQDINQMARNCVHKTQPAVATAAAAAAPTSTHQPTIAPGGMQHTSSTYSLGQSQGFSSTTAHQDTWAAHQALLQPRSQGVQGHSAVGQFSQHQQTGYAIPALGGQSLTAGTQQTNNYQAQTANRLQGSLGSMAAVKEEVTSPQQRMLTNAASLPFGSTQHTSSQQQQQQEGLVGSQGGAAGLTQHIPGMVPVGLSQAGAAAPQYTARPHDLPAPQLTHTTAYLGSSNNTASMGRVVTTNALQPSSRKVGSGGGGADVPATPFYGEAHLPTGNDLLQGLQAILQRINKQGGSGASQGGAAQQPDSATHNTSRGTAAPPDQLDTLLIHSNNPHTQPELPTPHSPTGELVYTRDVRGMHLLEGQFDRRTAHLRSLPIGMPMTPSGLDDLYPLSALPPTPNLGLEPIQGANESATAAPSQTSSMRGTNSCMMVPADGRLMVSDGGSGWLPSSMQPISQSRTGERASGLSMLGSHSMPQHGGAPHLGGLTVPSQGHNPQGGAVPRAAPPAVHISWQQTLPGFLNMTHMGGQLAGSGFLQHQQHQTGAGGGGGGVISRQLPSITGLGGARDSLYLSSMMPPVPWGEPPPALLGVGMQMTGGAEDDEGHTGRPGKAKRIRRKPKDNSLKKKPEPRPPARASQHSAHIAQLITEHGLVVPSFNRRIVGRNFYLGRSFMSSIFGAGFQCPLQCQLQLQINGEVQDKIYKVEFVAGSTSWYPRGLPLSLLRGREMCGARWQRPSEQPQPEPAAAGADAAAGGAAGDAPADQAPATSLADRVLIMVFQDVDQADSAV